MKSYKYRVVNIESLPDNPIVQGIPGSNEFDTLKEAKKSATKSIDPNNTRQQTLVIKCEKNGETYTWGWIVYTQPEK